MKGSEFQRFRGSQFTVQDSKVKGRKTRASEKPKKFILRSINAGGTEELNRPNGPNISKYIWKFCKRKFWYIINNSRKYSG